MFTASSSNEQKSKREKKKPEDAPSAETAALLINACKEKHDFLLVKKGRLVVRVPLGKREYIEFKKEVLDEAPNPDDPSSQSLPKGLTATYRDKVLTFVLGAEKHGVITLAKKCFTGYSGNALRYIRANHPKLLGDKAKITSSAKRFLTGGD